VKPEVKPWERDELGDRLAERAESARKAERRDLLSKVPTDVLACAEAAHEAMRVFHEAHGIRSFKTWRKTPDELRERAIMATFAVITGREAFATSENLGTRLLAEIHGSVALAIMRAFAKEREAEGPVIEIAQSLPPASVLPREETLPIRLTPTRPGPRLY